MPDTIRFSANIELQASADGKAPRFSAVAYSGGAMKPPGWPTVIIDVSGADVSGSIPVLADHGQDLDSICGEGRAEIRDGKILIAGPLTDASEAGRKVIGLARAGITLQMSVGYEPTKRESVSAGQTIRVNNRQFTAPDTGLLVLRAGKLREVSLLACGADPSTQVTIAAQRGATSKGKPMSTPSDYEAENLAEEKRLCAAAATLKTIDDEEKRLAMIDNYEAKFDVGSELAHQSRLLKASCVAGEIDLTAYRHGMADLIRAERPQPPAVHGSSRDTSGGDVRSFAAAGIMLRAGFSGAAERTFGEPVLHAAERRGRLHLLDLARGCLQSEGREPPSDRESLVKAAFSTVSLPAILGLAGEKVLLDAYVQAPGAWRNWCKIVSVQSFREHTLLRPSFLGGFEQLPPGGTIKNSWLGEETAVLKADTYAKILTIDRNAIVNDDCGAFAQAAAGLGKSAARKLSDLTISTLLGGVAGGFFTEARGNLLDSPLTLAAVAAAVSLLRSQVDADGDALDITPVVLLIGPSLESTARAICESEFIEAATGAPSGNSMRGILIPVVEPRLALASLGGSATAWSVLAGPSDAPQAVAFLNGSEFPTIESLGLQHDVSHLATAWRCYFDFGSALVDYRAAVISTGDGA